MATEARVFYYVEECPHVHECSSQSWKNAAVWGWTEQECRDQLKAHLINSSKHHLSVDDATTTSMLAEVKDHTDRNTVQMQGC